MTSAGTLDGAGCDDGFAADRGPTGAEARYHRHSYDLYRAQDRPPAAYNDDSAHGTRAGRARPPRPTCVEGATRQRSPPMLIRFDPFREFDRLTEQLTFSPRRACRVEAGQGVLGDMRVGMDRAVGDEFVDDRRQLVLRRRATPGRRHCRATASTTDRDAHDPAWPGTRARRWPRRRPRCRGLRRDRPRPARLAASSSSGSTRKGRHRGCPATSTAPRFATGCDARRRRAFPAAVVRAPRPTSPLVSVRCIVG